MIRIKDTNICEDCKVYSCSFLRTGQVRNDFCKLSSETTVCPTQILSEGPYEAALKTGIIDFDSKNKSNCIDCGLCISSCAFSNLEFCDVSFNLDNEAFANLTSPQLKATITSYLSKLFSFAANTNRNKSLIFDGFIFTSSEKKAFVEVDWNNDSLECTRRILGDILKYKNLASVSSGLIILHDLPSVGSRDVYNVLERIAKFPTTKDINIFISSIPIVRWLALFSNKRDFEVWDIGFNPLVESKEEYIQRINSFIPDSKHIIC